LCELPYENKGERGLHGTSVVAAKFFFLGIRGARTRGIVFLLGWMRNPKQHWLNRLHLANGKFFFFNLKSALEPPESGGSNALFRSKNGAAVQKIQW
jgi:hypothetical protein